MQIFINECSLVGQYHSAQEFTEAVRIFISLFSTINEQKGNVSAYKSKVFLTYKAIQNEEFQASFNRIENRQLKDAFRQIIFNRFNPKEWQNEQIHSNEEFFYCHELGNDIVTETSLAEAAERKLQNIDSDILLLNFTNSKFSGGSFANVEKGNEAEQKITIQILCFENQELLSTYLSNLFKNLTHDEKTILVDKARFRIATGIQPVQGRRVYEELRTGYFWYGDNLHLDHLEVFDRHGNHIGTATLEGELIPDSAERGRTISVR